MTRMLLALLLALPLIAEPPDLEQQIFIKTNQERLKLGLTPLKNASVLADCARQHSQEMFELGYFSHVSPTPGRATTRDRVNAFGVTSHTMGENIFMCSGQKLEDVPQLTIKRLMSSPSHRENILSTNFTSLGVGVYVSGPNVYVTQVFSADLE
ncbi:MAG: hypothetical protein AMXMBFR33_71780 [Candidatus Xenobia bacterium]